MSLPPPHFDAPVQSVREAPLHASALMDALLQYIKMISGVSLLGEAYLHYGLIGERSLGQQRVEPGVPRHCFANAARLAIREPSRWIYVEGLAVKESLPIPLEHAWVLDAETLEIVDNTWQGEQLCAYLGIPFYSEWLYTHLRKTHTYGVFGTGMRARSLGEFRDAVHPRWR